MLNAFIILAAASVLFISGKVRADLTAVLTLIALMLSGVLTPGEALAGFSNSIVIMMIGLFVVGGGIFQTGLARMIGSRLLRLAGKNETALLVTVMLVTALFGTVVSNTGTVAVMMPIAVSLAAAAQLSPGRLLMPLAFASSFGGMLTLIGTPPNLVIQETLIKAGYEKLGFFSFTPIGLVTLLTGIAAMLVLRAFLPKNEAGGARKDGRSPEALARKYELASSLFRVKASGGSPLRGKTLRELDLSAVYGINVIEIRRKSSAKNHFLKTINQEIAGPKTVIEEGDLLYVHGPFEGVRQFSEEWGLQLLDRGVPELKDNNSSYATADIGIAEVLLTPNSRFIGRFIKHSGFREKYRLNILGIQRKDRVLLHNLQEEKMRFGDALLVQGAWKDIALLAEEEDDVVVVGRPSEEALKVTADNKAPIAGGILLLMVALLVTEIIPAVLSVMIAAVLMVVFGCVRGMEQAYKTINWESVVLIGAMLPMSAAIEKTGAAVLLADVLAGTLGAYGPLALLAGIYAVTSIMTLFISNTACAVLLAPIALGAAEGLGASPYPFLFAVSVGASMCFASPFSTPPNALVMTAGRYTFAHYIKVGLPLQIAVGVAVIAVLPVLFPF